ncbi:phosphogluconate dehydrogenase (NAD(+)-dependent, decarboxylating) [Pediococcus claussenii]|uniref:6-phosphogluconate dehydrogenase n=1 Tax=Pediococcus claussenii (strain ATCC BAA-344 / DSM 14800 / JCM 18046 / KCTC 3811 / LMG 21948 / P06) TaxID=701521 RepID=G8PC39_PEDCP|nr:decarboxylating 6-phosphogluconate dehydrogenase [Pediococcus claussenii]AEV94858.1 6-phosphogluconate dehydrogenase [Pediococcus claussenii ATCC BAA-344]ANZ70054.1 6-phosphogluconate dehydrogenase [Pediococcus claussenii]ANZ71869.1 6-phosphogluconate dehydrogenase [Pediococcus claussenii]KRN21036.1 gnd protein [Pediococcus claussenii]
MKVGVIGLGKMGMNLALNMKENKHQPIGFDLDSKNLKEAQNLDIMTASNMDNLLSQLDEQKIVWAMVPSGKPTDSVLTELSEKLSKNDIIIDGGNSFYKDSIKHNELFTEKGIHFFDVGTSGGMSGARNDGNFMIGGDAEAFKIIEPLFKAIAAKNGYLYTGKAGSGHYLKMVHNGVEYGMMASIGEGFDVLEHSPFEYDNEAVARVWNNGSVIRSWLMELAEDAFKEDGNLDNIKGTMHSSGEGRWTLDEALNQEIATPVIAMALLMRYRSLENDTFSGKVVSALRNGFGGHATDKE